MSCEGEVMLSDVILRGHATRGNAYVQAKGLSVHVGYPVRPHRDDEPGYMW